MEGGPSYSITRLREPLFPFMVKVPDVSLNEPSVPSRLVILAALFAVGLTWANLYVPALGAWMLRDPDFMAKPAMAILSLFSEME